MRVISGKARGAKLLSVPGDSTRPILDRVKTSLFDIIRMRIQDAEVLDMFAGSGAVGIEALSQGAAHCVFLDLNKNAYQTIRKNLEHTKLVSQAEVRNADCFLYLKSCSRQFDMIYVAPPQYKGVWEEAMRVLAERPEVLAPGGFIIAQIDPKEYEALELSAFVETEQRKYGNTLLVFFEKNA